MKYFVTFIVSFLFMVGTALATAPLPDLVSGASGYNKTVTIFTSQARQEYAVLMSERSMCYTVVYENNFNSPVWVGRWMYSSFYFSGPRQANVVVFCKGQGHVVTVLIVKE